MEIQYHRHRQYTIKSANLDYDDANTGTTLLHVLETQFNPEPYSAFFDGCNVVNEPTFEAISFFTIISRQTGINQTLPNGSQTLFPYRAPKL